MDLYKMIGNAVSVVSKCLANAVVDILSEE